ncbi:MAG: ComF family protein [Alphaproteobacteria bacterium]|nr:ComF family protein [Alphaproteobacteria bacterium]
MWRSALDLVLPPRCLACDAGVSEPGALCPACFGRFGFVTEPFCRHCGLPFTHAGEASPAGLCSGCEAHPPAFDRARAVWRYDGASRPVLTGFKHADRTELAPHLARHMARAGATLLAEAALIAPVPLHRWRLIARRFNQAALLAHALGRIARRPVVADLLARQRATPSQGRLSAAERARNVAGAFAVRPHRMGLVAGKRVLVVDDVLTSGATASACAAVLKEAGAAGVDVLVLARVPHPADRLG